MKLLLDTVCNTCEHLYDRMHIMSLFLQKAYMQECSCYWIQTYGNIQHLHTNTHAEVSWKYVKMCKHTHTTAVLSLWWWLQAMQADEQDRGWHAPKEQICCPPSSHLPVFFTLGFFYLFPFLLLLLPSFHFSFTLLSTYFSAAGPFRVLLPPTLHPAIKDWHQFAMPSRCHLQNTNKSSFLRLASNKWQPSQTHTLLPLHPVSPVQLFTYN